MPLNRSRWPLLLALLALCVQLVTASGLASATEHCAGMSMPMQHMDGDCHGKASGTGDTGKVHCSSQLCTVACVVPAAPPAAATEVMTTLMVETRSADLMQPDLGSCLNDLLRPPRLGA